MTGWSLFLVVVAAVMVGNVLTLALIVAGDRLLRRPRSVAAARRAPAATVVEVNPASSSDVYRRREAWRQRHSRSPTVG